jgi:ketosteroid isomerase-like protein
MTRASLGDLGAVMTDDVQFSDPFNSVLGLNKTRKIFADMFDMLESPGSASRTQP